MARVGVRGPISSGGPGSEGIGRLGGEFCSICRISQG